MATLVASTSKAERITLEREATRADTDRAAAHDGLLSNELFMFSSSETKRGL
jgi:hypothetical protein